MTLSIHTASSFLNEKISIHETAFLASKNEIQVSNI